MLITMPAFLPLLNTSGMDLVWFGVLVVKFIDIGMLTPPLGFNVFAAKGVVGDTIPLTRIFRCVGWFLVCVLVVVILMISFPALSLFLPIPDELTHMRRALTPARGRATCLVPTGRREAP